MTCLRLPVSSQVGEDVDNGMNNSKVQGRQDVPRITEGGVCNSYRGTRKFVLVELTMF